MAVLLKTTFKKKKNFLGHKKAPKNCLSKKTLKRDLPEFQTTLFNGGCINTLLRAATISLVSENNRNTHKNIRLDSRDRVTVEVEPSIVVARTNENTPSFKTGPELSAAVGAPRLRSAHLHNMPTAKG